MAHGVEMNKVVVVSVLFAVLLGASFVLTRDPSDAHSTADRSRADNPTPDSTARYQGEEKVSVGGQKTLSANDSQLQIHKLESQTVRDILEHARMGIAAAQFKAGLLMEECARGHMTPEQLERAERSSISPEHFRMIKEEIERCAPVAELVSGDLAVESKQWMNAALQQKYPVAVARYLTRSEQTPSVESLDTALLDAVAASQKDVGVQSDAYLRVLAAMDKREAVTGIEADPRVRDAWTLMHCRVTRQCDPEVTREHFKSELKEVEWRALVSLETELTSRIESSDWQRLRLY